MKCPACNITLVISERQGIEIDYCPECRGVWLDRGELDKLIQKSTDTSVKRDFSSAHTYEKNYAEDDKHYKYGKKRKGFLGELFDF